MSSPIFVDSVAWIALLHSADSLHQETVDIYRKLVADARNLVTTSLVLVEVANTLSSQSRRHLAIEFERRLHSSEICEVVWIDQEVYQRSWSLFRERLDKSWSLVDCSSFVVMQERQIGEALTADHHFAQAGYHKLI